MKSETVKIHKRRNISRNYRRIYRSMPLFYNVLPLDDYIKKAKSPLLKNLNYKTNRSRMFTPPTYRPTAFSPFSQTNRSNGKILMINEENSQFTKGIQVLMNKTKIFTL